MSVPANHKPITSGPAGLRPRRILPFAIILLVSAAAAMATGWYRHIDAGALLERWDAIEAVVGNHRWTALAGFTSLYAALAALSLPCGALLTVAGGVIFGGIAGGIASLIGATAGGTVVFLAARSALGGWLVRRGGRRVETIAAGFCADAFNYLLFLRLVPAFPFWLVNLVPALCGVRLATFVAATALGIIPATFAFAFFGAGLASAIAAQAPAYRACMATGGTHCTLGFDPSAAATPELIAALVVLGVLALMPVAVRRYRAVRAPPQPRSGT
ncbi:MAG TPA: VTT domain-containing protein [Xanthobacteraceae bacterium]|nr:VTT domain-containing protein [Xanthobacteraceae bacterium]